MYMEEYESEEESEARFEADLERLENQQSYMSVSGDNFIANPTDIGAKCLWLKYTKNGEDVPRNVMERMIRVIEDDIDHYQSGCKQTRSLPGSLTQQEQQEPVYALLHCAKEDPDYFWQILYPSPGHTVIHYFPDSLVNNIRVEFPQKRRLKSDELYEVFGKQLGLVYEEKKSGVGERMRCRYLKTYKKKLKKQYEFFEP